MNVRVSNFDLSPLWISLKTGCVSIVFTATLGLLTAWYCTICKNKVLKVILDGLFSLPLVLPPTVLGFFLLMFFGNNQFIGQVYYAIFHKHIAFTFLATVIAAVVVAFPLMYRNTKSAFEQVDQDMVYAARIIGMNEFSIFIKVLIPNALPGIISGSLLAFARGLGEFGATTMLAGNIVGKTRTLPLAVYSEVMSGDMDSAAIYVWIIVLICFICVIGLNLYQFKVNKKRGY